MDTIANHHERVDGDGACRRGGDLAAAQVMAVPVWLAPLVPREPANDRQGADDTRQAGTLVEALVLGGLLALSYASAALHILA